MKIQEEIASVKVEDWKLDLVCECTMQRANNKKLIHYNTEIQKKRTVVASSAFRRYKG